MNDKLNITEPKIILDKIQDSIITKGSHTQNNNKKDTIEDKLSNDEKDLHKFASKPVSWRKIIGFSTGSIACLSLIGLTYFVVAYLKSHNVFIENNGIEYKLKLLSYLPILVICSCMYLIIEYELDKHTGILLITGSILTISGIILTLLAQNFSQYIVFFVLFYGIGTGLILCSIWGAMFDYFIDRSCKLGISIIAIICLADHHLLSQVSKMTTLNVIDSVFYENYNVTILALVMINTTLLAISYLLLKNSEFSSDDAEEEIEVILNV